MMITVGQHQLQTDCIAADELQDFISERELGLHELFVLTDSNTRQYCLPLLRSVEIPEENLINVEPGEHSKTLACVQNIISKLTELNATRNACLVSLGGGMITDLGGVVASMYKRGISVVNIPTSLLGIVDASIGGKCGIDVDHVKNVAGYFKFPDLIISDRRFLGTLPDEEWVNGLAEIMKHGFIHSRSLVDNLARIGLRPELDDRMKREISDLCHAAVSVKQDIVTRDPYEDGIRKVLNFGHTIGHALESAAMIHGSPLAHGTAIAAGMVMELWISRKLAGLSDRHFDVCCSLIRSVFPVSDPYSGYEQEILRLIHSDKKNSTAANVTMILLQSIEEPVIVELENIEPVREAIEYYRSL